MQSSFVLETCTTRQACRDACNGIRRILLALCSSGPAQATFAQKTQVLQSIRLGKKNSSTPSISYLCTSLMFIPDKHSPAEPLSPPRTAVVPRIAALSVCRPRSSSETTTSRKPFSYATISGPSQGEVTDTAERIRRYRSFFRESRHTNSMPRWPFTVCKTNNPGNFLPSVRHTPRSEVGLVLEVYSR